MSRIYASSDKVTGWSITLGNGWEQYEWFGSMIRYSGGHASRLYAHWNIYVLGIGFFLTIKF